jgi:lipoyl-dependent peroxiredoxin
MRCCSYSVVFALSSFKFFRSSNMDNPTVLYKAHAHATGGREGHAESSDKVLDLKLTTPKELGGAGATGTNPEQLFAAGYSACFLGAMKFIAGKSATKLPDTTEVAATVGIGPIPTGFAITVDLVITIPGMDKAAAQKIVDAAHIVCPYSNATRGNVAVTLSMV